MFTSMWTRFYCSLLRKAAAAAAAAAAGVECNAGGPRVIGD